MRYSNVLDVEYPFPLHKSSRRPWTGFHNDRHAAPHTKDRSWLTQDEHNSDGATSIQAVVRVEKNLIFECQLSGADLAVPYTRFGSGTAFVPIEVTAWSAFLSLEGSHNAKQAIFINEMCLYPSPNMRE